MMLLIQNSAYRSRTTAFSTRTGRSTQLSVVILNLDSFVINIYASMDSAQARLAASLLTPEEDRMHARGGGGSRSDHLLGKQRLQLTPRFDEKANNNTARGVGHAACARKCSLREMRVKVFTSAALMIANMSMMSCVLTMYIWWRREQRDLVFPHYVCWHHKNSDLVSRALIVVGDVSLVDFLR
eukprot:3051008-Amphidinium_carterae.2